MQFPSPSSSPASNSNRWQFWIDRGGKKAARDIKRCGARVERVNDLSRREA
jgi:hypothetical protein